MDSSLAINGATALAIRAPFLLAPEDLFPKAESSPLLALLAEYDETLARMHTLVSFIGSDDYSSALHHFLKGNSSKDRGYSSLTVESMFKTEKAVKHLDAAFWGRALALTDVYQSMPQKRREKWNENIEKMDVPTFEASTVFETIDELLRSREKFFAERIDGIFHALSGEHVTNAPQGFGRRMILSYLHGGYLGTSTTQIGYISDLRSVVARFMGRDDPRYDSTSRLVDIALARSGEWIDVDGGSLRLRVYKKGTGHLEIHPEMAWRLNLMLHSLHPHAIAAEHRSRTPKPVKGFRTIQRPLPFAVIGILTDTWHHAKVYHLSSEYRLPWRTDGDSKIYAEALRVLEGIGGVVESGRVNFDYNAHEVLGSIVASGCLPDQQTHQYYPSPGPVADVAIEMAGIGETDSVLEPSAGQGGLANRLPKERTTCVEISRMFCDVLAAKGFKVVHEDFLEWAKTAPSFDRVVMNPPFSEGRHQLHLKAAAGLVRPGGRLTCVLPASQRGKALLPGFECRWSEVLTNEFDGTGVSVAVLAAERVAVT